MENEKGDLIKKVESISLTNEQLIAENKELLLKMDTIIESKSSESKKLNLDLTKMSNSLNDALEENKSLLADVDNFKGISCFLFQLAEDLCYNYSGCN